MSGIIGSNEGSTADSATVSPKSLLILYPTEKSIESNSAFSVMKLCLELSGKGWSVNIQTVSGAHHCAARNKLLEQAYKIIKTPGEKVDYVLWLDSDHIFEPAAITNLISVIERFNIPCVSATYFTRSQDPKMVALTIDSYTDDTNKVPKKYRMWDEFQPNMLYEVDAIGFGMFMLKPEVIERIYETYGVPLFEFRVRGDILVGEDVTFCEKMKELGYKIYVHTGIVIGHSWTTVMDLEMVHFLHGVRNMKSDGWLLDEEGALLKQIAKDTALGCIVEIGSWKGKSTCFLAKGSKEGGNAKVYAIDPFTGSPEHTLLGLPIDTYADFMKNITEQGVADIITPMVMTSEEAAAKFTDAIGAVFIDGNHTYESVKQDYELWAPKVLPGGIVAFHDYESTFHGVTEAVDTGIAKDPGFFRLGKVGSIVFWRKK